MMMKKVLMKQIAQLNCGKLNGLVLRGFTFQFNRSLN